MPRAEIRPAFLLNRKFHLVSPKVMLFILSASFPIPHSTPSVSLGRCAPLDPVDSNFINCQLNAKCLQSIKDYLI